MAREPMPSMALLKDIPPFAGFPEAGRRFLVGLAMRNEKSYFEENREVYEQALLQPMRAFVVEAGQRLRRKVPRVVADPRVGGSLYRLARDTRFSSDKTPYKTWVAARLWDGAGPGKDASPGFYIQVEPEGVWVGGGMYRFDDGQLDRFREAVADDKARRELDRLVQRIGLEIGGQELKRRPRGYGPDHPGGDWLLFKGLYVTAPVDGRRARGAGLVDAAVEVYERILPLHAWLMHHVAVGVERPEEDDED